MILSCLAKEKFFCFDISIGMFPAINSSDKMIEMPSAIPHMYPVARYRVLLKKLSSKYLKLGERERSLIYPF